MVASYSSETLCGLAGLVFLHRNRTKELLDHLPIFFMASQGTPLSRYLSSADSYAVTVFDRAACILQRPLQTGEEYEYGPCAHRRSCR